MTLREYLFNFGIQGKDFAIMLDIVPNYLSQIVNGKRRPSVPLAIKIDKLTQGRVTKESLLFGTKEEKTFLPMKFGED